jgi:hypothetical protein
MRALDDDALQQAFDDLQNRFNGPTLPTQIPNMPCPACGGGVVSPGMMRTPMNVLSASVYISLRIRLARIVGGS